MVPFDYDPTVPIIFGAGRLDSLGRITQELGGRRVLLVTDSGVVAAGHAERAMASLEAPPLQPFLFQETRQNPTASLVAAGADFARQHGEIDCIIGLGGGSAMDCAKGINFLLTNGGQMEDYRGFGKATQPLLPSIGIPTTAGTGSEAQSYALISQDQTHQKMACGDRGARFRAVILDPELLSSLPRKLAAVSVMDALSHALESYVTTRRNPVSQMFAREAWMLLDRNWEVTLEDRLDLEAQGQLLLGAHWAGAAIENSMLGAAHACANPLTASFGITHGIAVGLMLPHVLRFNNSVVADSYQELLFAGGIGNGSLADSSERLIERLNQLSTRAGLPVRLRDCQVSRDSIPMLADQAVNEWTGTFNPKPLTHEIVIDLYEKAF